MSNSETFIHPRRVLFPLGLGTALSLMGDATLYAVLPTHTAEAGIALSSVGIILGVNRAVRLFLNGPAGLAYDRWPRRRLFVPALFIGALSTAVYAATRGFWPMLAGRLLWGLAWSGIWVGGATVILDVTTAQDRGRWTGLYQTWFFLGAALGAFAGGLLTDWLGYGATMWLGAAVTALGGLIALILLPETRSIRPDTANVRCCGPSVEETRPRLRANRGLWVAASLQGINRFVTAGVLAATMGLLAQDYLYRNGGSHQSASLAIGVATLTGALLAGRTLLSMVAAPLAGTMSDWLGSRWRVAAWGLAIGIISMALVAWGAPAAILTGISLGAVAGGSVQALATALTGDLVSQAQRGRAIGLLHTAGDLGSAIGPPTAYILIPWIGLRGVYLLCAGLFTAGLTLALLFRLRAR
ncbi:MAG TPA: MFS transporter [Anaerolineae bacterium]|nr:MFS transporter [Anaerolineae bacterium]